MIKLREVLAVRHLQGAKPGAVPFRWLALLMGVVCLFLMLFKR